MPVAASLRFFFNNSSLALNSFLIKMESISLDLENISLAGNENQFSKIIDRLSAAVYTCDKDGYITYYNKAAADLWGREPEIGRDMWCGSWKIYRADGSPLPLNECPMAVTLKEGRPVYDEEIVIERPDGTRRNILAQPQPLFNSPGEITGAVNTLVDITAYKTAEQAWHSSETLRKNEEYYHRMIAEVQDYAILLLDTDGTIKNWNKGAEKIKGYKAEEAIGLNFRAFYTQADRLNQLPERLIAEAENKGKASHEGWRVRKDGTTFWGSIVITALHDDNNNIIGFSKVTRDLTVRKMLEDELKLNAARLEEKNRELERMNQELSSFAYISSHDLQEPLRKIQTFANYILQFESNLSPKGKDYFNRIGAAAMRMQTLIQDLLAYSRTTVGEIRFETTDLNGLLEEVKAEIKEMAEQKQAVIQSSPLPRLRIIPFQFQQLLINILNNSLKFAKADVPPKISINADIIAGSEIAAQNENAVPEKIYHHLTISDNGIGFDPENNNKIFEIFQRLHGKHEYGGTGIGLAICKKIVENHGGFMMAEGKPEQGTTIHIYLPAS